MPEVRRKGIAPEALIDLRRRLEISAPRSHERRTILQQAAQLYGVSEVTLYRALRPQGWLRALQRSDYGTPRKLPREELEFYCELIAAFKLRTCNRKGRHISTVRAIEILENYGLETPRGFVKLKPGVLKKTTVNRYLKQWGYDHVTLTRPPPAVRFEARHSNDCWHFDLSPSDLKHVKRPWWVEEGRGQPLLMLYSVVDDRSGVCYQEYRCVYGEDVEGALRFLFNAMAPKPMEGFPFQGIPEMIYLDNGPVAKSHVFQQVMGYLGVNVVTHLPQGANRRHVTARAKGKVERPFRTVKETHEVLYRFHEPENEAEANQWLMNYLRHYNDKPHRSEPHSRLEDWVKNLGPSGLRAMCSWDRFCTFAREPERRKVGVDARVSVDGMIYEVDPDLAGEIVVLWWGLFDNELYVERGEHRYGPYRPTSGPIPLHRYRAYKKTKTEQRTERIEALAEKLGLPRAALEGDAELRLIEPTVPAGDTSVVPFFDPDPFQEFTYPNVIAAKRAIADYLGKALAKLPAEQLQYIEDLVAQTLNKREVMERIRHYFKSVVTRT